ncbi:hypothetical protein [Stutzerimonas nitrititolerans]|uniref:hypothetical protein n=1 Tax=Stutzerimonas nitrititolerans TaxID=2482751 RepID=UPI00289E4550|nr:hypothetical protein [Stutzerimonas nitrititolerans]
MATNIKQFDALVGKIFADLYESFPIELVMQPENYISVLLDVSKPEEELLGVAMLDAVSFYEATHRWLRKAGFIEVLSSNSEESRVVLTAKGLEALKLMPDSLGGDSLGDRLSQAAREGVVDQVRVLTGQVLGFGVRMGTEMISKVM